MWSDFYVSAVVLAAILLAPGYLALRAVGMARPTSACCAPIVSITLLSVLGQLLAFAGIPSSPLVLLAPLVAALAVAALAARRHVTQLSPSRADAWVPLVFLLVGMASPIASSRPASMTRPSSFRPMTSRTT